MARCRGDLCIAIARQMAEGLAMAHEHEIVHGHLSPSTIMMTGDGVVKMMDFGLPQEGSTWERARETGAATPEYRAPEQLRGDIPDERSDIWTFGLILYEMLTGIMPFRGSHLAGRMATIVAGDLPETGVVRGDVPGSFPISASSVSEHRSRTPPAEHERSAVTARSLAV